VNQIYVQAILLVSVTGRMREIPLRTSTVARYLHVLPHLLAEAVFLRVIGGVAGIIMGSEFSKAVSLAVGWPTSIASAAIAAGFLFSGTFARGSRRRNPYGLSSSIRSRACAMNDCFPARVARGCVGRAI
jgi:hypothetical protein